MLRIRRSLSSNAATEAAQNGVIADKYKEPRHRADLLDTAAFIQAKTANLSIGINVSDTETVDRRVIRDIVSCEVKLIKRSAARKSGDVR